MWRGAVWSPLCLQWELRDIESQKSEDDKQLVVVEFRRDHLESFLLKERNSDFFTVLMNS